MRKYRLVWLAVFSVVIWMFLQLPPMVAARDSVLGTYRALIEVDALAKQHFVENVTPELLVDGAIRGLLYQLDPYSGYLAPNALAEYERRNAGNYIGVGIEIGLRRGKPTVIAPLEGSPAARAGILPGDFILSVDGTSVDGLSMFDIEELLGGKPGSVVHLSILRSGSDEPETVDVPRGPVGIRTVRGFRKTPGGDWDYMIDPAHRIGYTRIASFNDHTIDEFAAALDELGHDLRGLVIDLRFNPGGRLFQAVRMVDRFVDDGVILETITRRRAVTTYRARPANTIVNLKLAVLINQNSASAAEIVSGSLQDHGRAVIVGERSFGKGSVQMLIHLTTQRAGIRLTTAYYRLPSGRIIHRTTGNEHSADWGVTPDVEVRLSDDEVVALRQSRRSGESLSTDVEKTQEAPDAAPITETADPPVIMYDRQLTTALSLLAE